MHRRTLAMQLLELGKNNPKSFWNVIKKMNNWGKEKNDPADKISPKHWREHFEKLLNSSKPEPTAHASGGSFEPIIDSRITLKEILEALRDLKAGKAPGPDNILVEYLRIFAEAYPDILHILLNKIFCDHMYPSNWTVNFLKPIFKKGDQGDTENYRGLAIGSAFAKLSSQILLKRLTKYVDEKKLLSPHQGGFHKGKSTSDHIFLLQTIIEKVVKKATKSSTLLL